MFMECTPPDLSISSLPFNEPDVKTIFYTSTVLRASISQLATMSYSSRATLPPSHMRQTSTSANLNLLTRVNEKKAELESLRELRDLSAAVATQMEALEQKLSTLSDGTEGMQLTSYY